MSFLSDAFEGNWSHLGTDLSHAGSSLMNHPSEMWETLGGAAALATGGLALGALPEFGAAAGAAEGGGLFSGLLGGGADAAAVGGDISAGATGFGTEALTGAGGASTDAAFAGPGWSAVAGEGGITPIASGTSVGADTGITGSIMGVPTGPGAPTPGSGFMSTLTDPSQWTLGGVGKVGGALAAGAGLGMNMLRGNRMDPNQQALSGQAALESQQGQQLMSYLQKGTLPPAMKAKLDQAVASERARIMSRYPAGSTPANNSQLAQELNAVETNAVAAMAQVQVEMLNAGLKETGMSTEIYNILTKLDMQQNDELMKSIMSFAAALGGGGMLRQVAA